MIPAASYSAIAVKLNWLNNHPIDFSWLPQPLSQTLVSFFLNPNIHSPQRWNLPVATNSPTPDIRDKKSLPLQIPSPQCITDWPPHLFPTQGDFGRHIRKQLVNQFTRPLTVLQQQRFHSVARHTLQLSQCSHLLPEDKPVANLWQYSTSLFSLTSFYELRNQAFLTTSALLLDILVLSYTCSTCTVFENNTTKLCSNRPLGRHALEHINTRFKFSKLIKCTLCTRTHQNCKQLRCSHNVCRIQPAIS